MNELILTLPWPPSVNHYKKIGGIIKTKSGKTYQKRINSKETIGFYYEVYSIYHASMHQEWVKYADDEEIGYEVWVCLYPPDKRRRDIDNSLKVLLDSLVHAKVIKDDSQIIRLTIERDKVVNGGKVIVKITPKSIALIEK